MIYSIRKNVLKLRFPPLLYKSKFLFANYLLQITNYWYYYWNLVNNPLCSPITSLDTILTWQLSANPTSRPIMWWRQRIRMQFQSSLSETSSQKSEKRIQNVSRYWGLLTAEFGVSARREIIIARWTYFTWFGFIR